jgi:DNA-directed RNA polymerase subunit RPC12/RpoP
MMTETFLGVRINPTWPSDIRKGVSLLVSDDPCEFFKGLKVLTSIHASNIDETKRAIAASLLDVLCHVLPGYIKPDGDEYVLNIARINNALDREQHPLHVLTRPAPQSSTVREAPSADLEDDDDIKVLSVEDTRPETESIAEQARQEILAHIEETLLDVDLSPPSQGISPISQKPPISSESTMLISSQPPDDDVADNWIDPSEFLGDIDASSLNFDLLPGLKVAAESAAIKNRTCGLGDGSIDPDDTVYVCAHCKAAFHAGCANIVENLMGASCPICQASWYE